MYSLSVACSFYTICMYSLWYAACSLYTICMYSLWYAACSLYTICMYSLSVACSLYTICMYSQYSQVGNTTPDDLLTRLSAALHTLTTAPSGGELILDDLLIRYEEVLITAKCGLLEPSVFTESRQEVADEIRITRVHLLLYNATNNIIKCVLQLALGLPVSLVNNLVYISESVGHV